MISKVENFIRSLTKIFEIKSFLRAFNQLKDGIHHQLLIPRFNGRGRH